METSERLGGRGFANWSMNPRKVNCHQKRLIVSLIDRRPQVNVPSPIFLFENRALDSAELYMSQ